MNCIDCNRIDRPDNFLEVAKLKFSEKHGLLSLEVEGEGSYPGVEVYAAAPLRHPYEMISIRDRMDPELKEIGLIKSISDLSPLSQSLVKKALDQRYFMPSVLKILEVSDSYTTLVWKVLTDRGPAEILLKDPHEYIRPLGPDAFILVDIDECRYKIEDIKKLDKKSQRLFEKYYYQ